MKLSFTKMHGCGNDFVVVDATAAVRAWAPTARQAAFLLDRHCGVGGDQLLVLYPARAGDARMAIFNADGSEAEMCGNGIRCCALYLRRRGLTHKTALKIETLAGMIEPVIERDAVRVNMGVPRLAAEEIPVAGQRGRVIDAPPPGITGGGVLPRMTCVSMGNPHAVFFVEDVAAVPLAAVGPLVERHALFPKRTNVEFAQVLARDRVRVRVWERGSGITRACGTGACGTAVAGIISGRLDATVTVVLDGGELLISWDGTNGPVWMTGPATEVFDGSIEIAD